MNETTKPQQPSPQNDDMSDLSWLIQVADDPLGPFAIARHHPLTPPSKKEEPKS